MRVVREGTIPSERLWEGECRNCKSVVEAKEAELTHIDHDMREGYSFSWETCPVCGYGEGKKGYGGVLFYRKGEAK